MKKIAMWAAALIASALIFASCQTSSCNCGLGQAEPQEIQANA